MFPFSFKAVNLKFSKIGTAIYKDSLNCFPNFTKNFSGVVSYGGDEYQMYLINCFPVNS